MYLENNICEGVRTDDTCMESTTNMMGCARMIHVWRVEHVCGDAQG